jgi:hypothetical protein
MKIELNRAQMRFMKIEAPYRAMITGYGGGKTYTVCMAQVAHFLEHPKLIQAYYAPTYPQIRDIFYPTIEEVSYIFGIETIIKTTDKEVDFYKNGRFVGTTICRSMDNPNSIVGYKVARSAVDEIDTLPQKKAEDVWYKIIARQRLKYEKPNGVDFATTPEGYRFAYSVFEKKELRGKRLPDELYGYTRGSTQENAANLPDDYIKNLKDTYPEKLIDAYINGYFTNLESGSVFYCFDRNKQNSNETIKQGDVLHIGMDFNVTNMHAVIIVARGESLHVVDEIDGALDTRQMCDILKDRYSAHKIYIYPDSSGKNRSSADAGISDIRMLRNAGFSVIFDPTNPQVKDSVNAVNNEIEKNRLFVNISRCPGCAESLERHAYDKNNMPDKLGGYDHYTDCVRYVISKLKPVHKNRARITK